MSSPYSSEYTWRTVGPGSLPNLRAGTSGTFQWSASPVPNTKPRALAAELRARGAHVYVPRQDFDYALNVGLRMLLLRRLIGERDGLYYAQAEELPLLRYYANSISHLA